MAEYNNGTPLRLSATFSLLGVPTDPTSVVLRLRKPTGSLLAYTFGAGPSIVRTGPGVYHCDLLEYLRGQWFLQWEGTGTVPVWVEDTFTLNAKQYIL